MTDREELTELLDTCRRLGAEVVTTETLDGELTSVRFVKEPGCGPLPITGMVHAAERLRTVKARRESLTTATVDWNGSTVTLVHDGLKLLAVHPLLGRQVFAEDCNVKISPENLVELFDDSRTSCTL